MGYIVGDRIDYNGVRALRGKLHVFSKNQPKYPSGRFSSNFRNFN